MRLAPIKQVNALWINIANLSIVLMNMIHEKGAIWISTHGSGVPFLHVRFDTSPKYLDWVPGINKHGQGKWAKYMERFQNY